MGQRGKPAMSSRELRIAYLEACTEIRRLREQVERLARDNIAMSGRLAEIDLGPDRMDVHVVPWDQPTQETPAPAAPCVNLVKRPLRRVSQIILPPLSAEEAAQNMQTFMIRIREASTDQGMRIL